MRAVNRIACFLLMLCMMLMSVGAHAHGTVHLSDNVGHSHASHAPEPSADAQTLEQTDPSHDGCLHAHCGHSHSAALAGVERAKLQIPGNEPAPQVASSGFTSTPPDEIERPKWQFTTPRRGESALT